MLLQRPCRRAPLKGQLPLPEVIRRVSHVPRTDRVRLNWLARLYAAKTGARASGDDLFGEAITRVIAGQRRWPDHVGTVAFLAGTMMSIASEWRGKAARDLPDLSTAGLEDAAEAPGPADDETATALRLERFLI